MDWKALDAHILALLAEAVRAHRLERPAESIYAAVFHNFHAEAGGLICWPQLAIASEEDLRALSDESGLAPDSLRWSPADWSAQLDPSEADDAMAAAVENWAVGRGAERWENAYQRFLRAFPRAAKAARRILVAEGVVGRDFVALAMDEAWELVPLSLTAAQVRTHFPELDEEARELARLAALPAPARAAELGDILDDPVPGPVSREDAARLLAELGRVAVVLASERLPRVRDAWRWAKLLADLGIPDPAAVEALLAVVLGRRLPETSRAWAAAALSRLGRLDLVLADREQIPRSVLLRALAAPYTSFRDQGVVHLPLDYAPLEGVLAGDPELAAEMLEELRPGSGYCALTPDEVETARAALGSSVEVVRQHAASVLEAAGA